MYKPSVTSIIGPNGYCTTCNNTGWKVVYKQGDLVPGTQCDGWNRTTYASTLYVTCDCCIIKTEAVEVCPSSLLLVR